MCYDTDMSSRRRLFFYIMVNIIVSACVVVSFLYLYDRYFRSSQPVTLPPLGTPVAGTSSRMELDIVSVAGAGILANEVVEIHNNSGKEVNLSGWKLQSADGRSFTFPALTLLNGGFVKVHSQNGKNTVVDLYWGLSKPAWQSGQLAILLDGSENVQALYRIP